jgi:hypothetical protein
MKTEPESLTSFDDPTGATGERDNARAYTRPVRKFKGLPLHPYSHGIDLLFSQVTDFAADTQFYHWVAFIFLLLVRDPELTPVEDRKRNVLPLAWNIEGFRAAVLEWLDEIKWTPANSVEAEKLFKNIRAEAARAAVEPVGGGKKKPAARSRRKRHS